MEQEHLKQKGEGRIPKCGVHVVYRRNRSIPTLRLEWRLDELTKEVIQVRTLTFTES